MYLAHCILGDYIVLSLSTEKQHSRTYPAKIYHLCEATSSVLVGASSAATQDGPGYAPTLRPYLDGFCARCDLAVLLARYPSLYYTCCD